MPRLRTLLLATYRGYSVLRMLTGLCTPSSSRYRLHSGGQEPLRVQPDANGALCLLLMIAIGDDDLIEGRVCRELHFGVLGQSTQALLKVRVRRSSFPRL